MPKYTYTSTRVSEVSIVNYVPEYTYTPTRVNEVSIVNSQSLCVRVHIQPPILVSEAAIVNSQSPCHCISYSETRAMIFI